MLAHLCSENEPHTSVCVCSKLLPPVLRVKGPPCQVSANFGKLILISWDIGFLLFQKSSNISSCYHRAFYKHFKIHTQNHFTRPQSPKLKYKRFIKQMMRSAISHFANFSWHLQRYYTGGHADSRLKREGGNLILMKKLSN